MGRRVGALLVVFTFLTACAHGDAGAIVEVELDRSLSRAEIDAELPALFEAVQPPAARYDVDIHYLDFETMDLDGSAVSTRAQLFVPLLEEAERVPLYLFAPGSTGLTHGCRMSREHLINVDWGRYRVHGLAHAAQGSIVVMPDYMHSDVIGGIEPYFISIAEARVVLDAVRAARLFLVGSDYHAQPASGVFLAGYSQGGHAVFSAADLRDEYAPDVEIAGIIGYGPSTNVENLFREWTVAAPMVIYAYSRFYGEGQFDPARMLADRWLDSLSHDVMTQCIGGIQGFYPLEPGPLFRPEFTEVLLDGRLADEYPDIAELMEENNAGLSGHGIPVLILAGSDDIVVFPKSQTEFVTALCELGSPVRYRIYEGARHDTRQIGFDEAVDWMRARLDDEPPPSDCEQYR